MKKKHYSAYDVIATRIIELKIIITGNAKSVRNEANKSRMLSAPRNASPPYSDTRFMVASKSLKIQLI
jgi:hypothetical protein